MNKTSEMGVGRVNENPGNRKTITIKINGKERPFHDKEKGNTEMESATLIEEKRSSSSTKFGEEVAAGSEAIDDESFDWILPGEEEMEEEPEILVNGSSPEKKKAFFERKIKEEKGNKKSVPKRVIPSVFFTVLFAVVLGTGFGFILLKMVSSDQQVTSKQNAAVSTAETETKTAEKTNTEAKNSNNTAASTIIATKKDISTFVVQHIILSNENAVKQVQSQLTNKGYISQEIAINGKMAVYLGVASELEGAKTWAKAIKKDKVEAFAKPITFNGGGKIKNITKEEKSFIEKSPAIYHSLTAFVSSVQFAGASSAEEKEELKKQQAVLDKMKIADFKNKEVKSMALQLNEGITKSIALADNSKEDAQAVQKNLLAFLEKYVELN